jgi:flagellar protein FlaG
MDIRPTDKTAAAGAGISGIKLEPSTAAAARSSAPLAKAEAAAASAAPGKEALQQALGSINDVLRDRAPGLEFTFDKDDARLVVKVVDRDTNEVIRQMPSREALEIAKALDKLQSLLARQTA